MANKYCSILYHTYLDRRLDGSEVDGFEDIPVQLGSLLRLEGEPHLFFYIIMNEKFENTTKLKCKTHTDKIPEYTSKSHVML